MSLVVEGKVAVKKVDAKRFDLRELEVTMEVSLVHKCRVSIKPR